MKNTDKWGGGDQGVALSCPRILELCSCVGGIGGVGSDDEVLSPSISLVTIVSHWWPCVLRAGKPAPPTGVF